MIFMLNPIFIIFLWIAFTISIIALANYGEYLVEKGEERRSCGAVNEDLEDAGVLEDVEFSDCEKEIELMNKRADASRRAHSIMGSAKRSVAVFVVSIFSAWLFLFGGFFCFPRVMKSKMFPLIIIGAMFAATLIMFIAVFVLPQIRASMVKRTDIKGMPGGKRTKAGEKHGKQDKDDAVPNPVVKESGPFDLFRH